MNENIKHLPNGDFEDEKRNVLDKDDSCVYDRKDIDKKKGK